MTLDREPLNSECLSGCLVRRLFNCWIYFTTFAYFVAIGSCAKFICELVVPIFGYPWFIFELGGTLKATSSTLFRNDTKVSYYGNAEGDKNLFSKYGQKAFITGNKQVLDFSISVE